MRISDISMFRRCSPLLSAIFLVVSVLKFAKAEVPTLEATVGKAVAYLKHGGETWMAKQGCVSCHQIPSMLWSLRVAEEHGLLAAGGVTSDELQQYVDWSVAPINFVKPEQKEAVVVDEALASNVDTLAALLIGITAEPDAAWRQEFIAKLCAEQKADGSWGACGQLPLQKRPPRETDQATTMWASLALLRYGAQSVGDEKLDAENSEFVGFDLEPALEFSGCNATTTQARSTEWYALQVLMAHERRTPMLADRIELLLEKQNTDGGWGWLVGDKSDALGTGFALYALAELDVSDRSEVAQAAMERARECLFQSQDADGSWKVPGTKKAAKGRNTATSVYWGTAWAVIGLLEADRALQLAEQPTRKH